MNENFIGKNVLVDGITKRYFGKIVRFENDRCVLIDAKEIKSENSLKDLAHGKGIYTLGEKIREVTTLFVELWWDLYPFGEYDC